ncbi:kinase-like domain-containing protein [Fusarium circinatum]|uniref:Kinase-like domain-containing protein n=1 Tax=Fusarium circinatum TaxID=48490 RepID=A0A8H5TC01_FUSCI|nr:kinase-like domain-containing protein [Fusarium circinatum]
MDNPAEGPSGYHVGDVLQLQILQTNTDVLPQNDTVSVTISQLITCTMSPVVRVNFDTGCAILKLYDRRFGSSFREHDDEIIPYCDQAQAAYHSFLQRGAMGPFLKELDDELSSPDVIVPRTASDLRDEPDGVARFEAALWRNANNAFKTESEAYTRMQDLQGALIPKLYAVVRVVIAKENNTQDNEYLEIHGILLEPIAGCSLRDLITASYAPTTKEEWSFIVQRAVDSAHEINKRGIVLDDSAPRNVVVDQTSHHIFLVDFAQCFFRDTMFEDWEKEAEGWDAAAEYCEVVRTHNNPAAIGLPMVRRVRNKFGWNLDIVYPESDDVLSETKSQTPDQQDCHLAPQSVGVPDTET